MSQKKIYDVVVSALENLPEGARLQRNRWGSPSSMAQGGPACLVGAIGYKYRPTRDEVQTSVGLLGGFDEYSPEYVAPTITNGAAGVIDDGVLVALSDGFEGEPCYFSGGTYRFCHELGKAVYENLHTRKLPTLRTIQRRAKKTPREDKMNNTIKAMAQTMMDSLEAYNQEDAAKVIAALSLVVKAVCVASETTTAEFKELTDEWTL